MRRAFVIVVLASIAIAALAAGPVMSMIEQPEYKVERSERSLEVRAYPAMTVATTVVGGSRGGAVNKGFRTLASYIFGANDGSKKIEMTTPVMQGGEKNEWTVRFVMPRNWSKESLPKPREPRVTIETVPASSFAVIRFSGFWRDALLQQKTAELEAYIARNKLKIVGVPIYAFYNPPWTLPMFRRNEVMIEVQP